MVIRAKPRMKRVLRTCGFIPSSMIIGLDFNRLKKGLRTEICFKRPTIEINVEWLAFSLISRGAKFASIRVRVLSYIKVTARYVVSKTNRYAMWIKYTLTVTRQTGSQNLFVGVCVLGGAENKKEIELCKIASKAVIRETKCPNLLYYRRMLIYTDKILIHRSF